MPEVRRGLLKNMLENRKHIRVIETSNGISGLIAENTKVTDELTGEIKEFDAMWISSLCDSTFKGKPDNEVVDFSSRISTINEILEVTTKPIILDGDTGGKIEHFVYNVNTLERLGVSAIIIEDKTGLKQNSLLGTEVKQQLEDPDIFAEKIKAGKEAQLTDEFMIFARIESLIAGKDVADAIDRARKYIDAGADGIMIPLEITWINGEKYEIDSVLDIRQAAALRAGGHGDRYTVCVRGQCSFLFFERSQQRIGNYIGRWFVERRR